MSSKKIYFMQPKAHVRMFDPAVTRSEIRSLIEEGWNIFEIGDSVIEGCEAVFMDKQVGLRKVIECSSLTKQEQADFHRLLDKLEFNGDIKL